MSNLAETYTHVPDVDDDMRLENTLARLGGSTRVSKGGLRRLSAPDAQVLLADVLREVDETILPRQFIIGTKNRQVAHLHVSGRRLLRLDIPGDIPPDQELPNDPDEIAVVFACQLQAFLAGSTKVMLRSTRKVLESDPSELGCTASNMAAAASVAIAAPKSDAVGSEFFSEMGRHSIAWLMLDPDGQVIDGDGSEKQTAQLADLSRDDLAELDEQLELVSGAPGSPGLVVLNYGADTGLCLVYARSPTTGFLAVLLSQAVSKVQSVWCAHFG